MGSVVWQVDHDGQEEEEDHWTFKKGRFQGSTMLRDYRGSVKLDFLLIQEGAASYDCCEKGPRVLVFLLISPLTPNVRLLKHYSLILGGKTSRACFVFVFASFGAHPLGRSAESEKSVEMCSASTHYNGDDGMFGFRFLGEKQ